MAWMKRLIYYCPECDADKPLLRITRCADVDELCETCDKRGYIAFIKSVGQLPGDRNYSHPLHSDSLAISPSQIAEHRKLFPDVKIDGEGRPVFENYRQHDNYLETCGFDKKEQRIKPKGRRIDKSKQPPQRGLPLKEI